MQNSKDSSPSCSGCRIEWRPSRWLVTGLVMLAPLASYAVIASALFEDAGRPLAGLVLVLGLVRARRAANEPSCTLHWVGGGQPAGIDRAGQRLELRGVELEIRGPIVRLQGRDGRGRRHHLVWWPDTLDAGARRQLVLRARAGHRSDINLPSMAA
jgi:toxin CptA